MTQDPGAESKMLDSPAFKYLSAGSHTVQKNRNLPILNAEEWQAWRGRLQVWEYLQKEKIEEGVAELGKYRSNRTGYRKQISGLQKDAEEPVCWERHIQRRNMGKKFFLLEIIRKWKLKEVGFQEKKEHWWSWIHSGFIWCSYIPNETSNLCERLQIKLVSTANCFQKMR